MNRKKRKVTIRTKGLCHLEFCPWNYEMETISFWNWSSWLHFRQDSNTPINVNFSWFLKSKLCLVWGDSRRRSRKVELGIIFQKFFFWRKKGVLLLFETTKISGDRLLKITIQWNPMHRTINVQAFCIFYMCYLNLSIKLSRKF